MATPFNFINFVGYTNSLLRSRNQEVSLLWIYSILKSMQRQGYFTHLKVRWDYDLNFTGHALLKLEYEPDSIVLVLNQLGLGSLDGPLPLEMTQLLHHIKHDESLRRQLQVSLKLDTPIAPAPQSLVDGGDDHSQDSSAHQAQGGNAQESMEQGIVMFLDLLSEKLFEFYEQSTARGSLSAQVFNQPEPLRSMLYSLIGVNESTQYNLSKSELTAALPLLIGPMQGSMDALKLLLQKILEVPVAIQPKEYATYPIPLEYRSHLSYHHCVLGQNLQLGSRYASFKRKFTLILGPLDYETFIKIQGEHGWGAQNLTQDLCRLVLNQALDYSVVYLIYTDSIPALCLGRSATAYGTVTTSATAATFATASAHAGSDNSSNDPTGNTNHSPVAGLVRQLDWALEQQSQRPAMPQSRLALGRGAVLRNHHTLPVLGLVRQCYHTRQ